MCKFSDPSEQEKKRACGNLGGVDFVLVKLVCSSLVGNYK
jgi:hypothetical protein